jgi:hypothetical protein
MNWDVREIGVTRDPRFQIACPPTSSDVFGLRISGFFRFSDFGLLIFSLSCSSC